MKASKTLIDKLKEFEGYSPVAYKCPAGAWTVGYGHTDGVRRGDKVTCEEAELLLRRDLRAVEAHVEALFPQGIRQCRFDALVSFAYNVGCAALDGSTLLRKIRSCAPDAEIRAEFARWVYATVSGRKRKLPGLVERREWEARRFFNEA